MIKGGNVSGEKKRAMYFYRSKMVKIMTKGGIQKARGGGGIPPIPPSHFPLFFSPRLLTTVPKIGP